MFDWEDLRHFIAVAQAGSVSGAARVLDVDHSTVSRRLAALEAALQTTLVERLPRASRLTVIGHEILARASEIETNAFAIERIARDARRDLQGKVIVSAPAVLATHILAQQVAAFRRLYPHLRLSVATQAHSASLSRREADIAVRLFRPTEDSYVARKLSTMPFGLYASPQYVFRDEPGRWGFIAYDEQSEDMPHQRWLLATAGTRPVVCEVSDITSQLVAARTGIGVASLPCFIGDKDPDLVGLAFDGVPFEREVWLVLHPQMKSAPSIRAAADFIAGAIKRTVVGRGGPSA